MTKTNGFEWPRPIPAGTLVAVVSAVDIDRVQRIARVVRDDGALVEVETDDEIEGEAAIEMDFPTPDPAVLTVPASRLRPIVGDPRSR